MTGSARPRLQGAAHSRLGAQDRRTQDVHQDSKSSPKQPGIKKTDHECDADDEAQAQHCFHPWLFSRHVPELFAKKEESQAHHRQ